MAFDEALAERIRQQLAGRKNVEEKKMFGGVGFLLNGNLLVGVWKESPIVRLGPDQTEEALLEPHVKEFDITGRPMKGVPPITPMATGRPGLMAMRQNTSLPTLSTAALT